jgi:DnaD/phage-associated family protein
MDKRVSDFAGKRKLALLPAVFMTEILSEVADLDELKVILAIFYLAHDEHGKWCVTREEIKSSGILKMEEGVLAGALVRATEHGIIFGKMPGIDDKSAESYSVNMGILGEYAGGGLSAKEKKFFSDSEELLCQPQAAIFALYERNVGLITPGIAEKLKEAEKLYPAEWIEDAFKEAVGANKRSWGYIASVLKRWEREGKKSGAHTRGIEKDAADKYVKGKYGHLVKR